MVHGQAFNTHKAIHIWLLLAGNGILRSVVYAVAQSLYHHLSVCGNGSEARGIFVSIIVEKIINVSHITTKHCTVEGCMYNTPVIYMYVTSCGKPMHKGNMACVCVCLLDCLSV